MTTDLHIPLAGATRYDFKCSVLREWEGWRVLAVDANQQLLVDAVPAAFDLEVAVDTLIALGWVVSRWDKFFHIRAWRGDNLPITRIDFRRQNNGRWRIQKYKAGWTASTEPSQDYVAPHGWNPDQALTWFKERAPVDYTDLDGWRVQWAGRCFFRAWQGPMLPVRATTQIIRMRDAVREWRNGQLLYKDSEPWRVKPRPDWLPPDIDVTQIEQNQLDLAYLL